MDQCTHEVRAEYWKSIIQSCSQRPAGQTAKSWMEENGICEQSYYHWQRKFRLQAYNLMKDEKSTLPVVREKTEVSFVEIPCLPLQQKETMPAERTSMDRAPGNSAPAAVIRTSSMSIEISNGIADGILACILKELSHA